MFHVVDSEEVQRGRHLAVEHKEDDRFQHQQEGDDHLAARGTVQRKGFFGEHNHDTNGDNRQCPAGNHLVVQQPAGNGYQSDYAHQDHQQLFHLQRFEVRLGTVLFNPLVAHHKVDQGDQHAHHAQ
ncbi:hypothetical protein D3C72_1790500 [compost metagenome]